MDGSKCEIEKHLQDLLVEDLFSPREPPNREQIVVDFSSYKVIPFENNDEVTNDIFLNDDDETVELDVKIDRNIFNVNESKNIPNDEYSDINIEDLVNSNINIEDIINNNILNSTITEIKTVKTEPNRTEAGKAETKGDRTEVKSDKTEASKTETDKTEASKTEASKTEASKTETDKTETNRTEACKTETDRTEACKTEACKTETDKTEVDKTEADKTDTDKTEADKTETDKTETDRTETDRTETDRTEPCKTDTCKIDTGKIDTDKIEAGKTEITGDRKEVKIDKTDTDRTETDKTEACKTELKSDRTEVKGDRTEVKGDRTEIKKKEDDILLIVSTGRTGSTTLVNILNTIPNTNICGENYNAVLKLLCCYYELKQVKLEIPTSENYNTFNLTKSRNIIKGLIISLFKKNAETDLWGFKEVRWFEDLRMLKVFREFFPEVKIIYNTRLDLEKHSKSAFWGEQPDSISLITKQSSETLAFLEKENFKFFNINLEDFYDSSIMEKMFDFIGRKDFYNEDAVQKILDQTKKIYSRGIHLHLHTYYPAKYKFVHVPKTGGSAIERFIKPYSNTIIGFGHDNTCKENGFPVIIIRYPVDRFISMYYYWKYGSEIYKRDAVWLKKYKSFTIKDFITLIDQNSTSNLHHGFTWDQHFAPYSEWIDEDSYSKTVVILYESDLSPKIQELLEYINPPKIEKDLVVKKINVSRKGGFCDLDSDDLEWLKKKYTGDFILWNKLHQQPELFRKII